MGRLAKKAAGTAPIEEANRKAFRAAGIDPRLASNQQIAEAVWAWIRAHVDYVPDPKGTELLKGPLSVLAEEDPSGDCDEHSMLAAAMLETEGVPAGFRAVAQRDPDTYNHVFGRYEAGGEWRSIDSTISRPPQRTLHDSLASKEIHLSTMAVQGPDDSTQRNGTSLQLAGHDGGQQVRDTTTTEDQGKWQQTLDDVLNVTPDIIRALKGGGSGSGGHTGGGTVPTNPTQPVPDSEPSMLANPAVLGMGGVALLGGGYFLAKNMG
jgi:hypothetical protein